MTKSEKSIKTESPMVALDAQGRELPSDVSLVSVVDKRPVTLGERIRKYMRSPVLQQHLEDPRYWDPEDIETIALEEEIPMTKYEGRADLLFAEIQSRVQKRKAAQLEEEIELERKANERFAAQYKALQEAGSIPATPPASLTGAQPEGLTKPTKA